MLQNISMFLPQKFLDNTNKTCPQVKGRYRESKRLQACLVKNMEPKSQKAVAF